MTACLNAGVKYLGNKALHGPRPDKAVVKEIFYKSLPGYRHAGTE